jgi:hypothetical protein
MLMAVPRRGAAPTLAGPQRDQEIQRRPPLAAGTKSREQLFAQSTVQARPLLDARRDWERIES